MVLAALAAQPAWAQEVPAERSSETVLADGVDAGRGAARVRALVELGARMGGTASGGAANTWRLERFAAMGLEAQAVDDGITWVHQESGWSLEAHAAQERCVLVRTWPYRFSPAGSGRAALATRQGAAPGVLLARMPRLRPDGTQLVLVDGRNTSAGDYPVIHPLPPGDHNPFPVFGISAEDGGWLRERLAAGLAVEVEWRLETTIEEALVQTVFARLPAREGAAPGYFLVCAHGDADAGGPGANDNGSGEAIVLEIAETLAAGVRSGALPAPAREIRFALWGSEIFSSQAHLERELAAKGNTTGEDAAPHAPLLGVLNFDQSGFGAVGDIFHVEPDDEAANAGFVRTVLGVLEDHRGHEDFPSRWVTVRSLGGTDSYVYSRSPLFRAEGLPSLTLYASAWGRAASHPRTAGMPGASWEDLPRVPVDHDPYYHSSGDTPENTTDRTPHVLGWHARVGAIALWRWLEGLDD